MNSTTDIREAWQQLYASVNLYVDGLEESFKIREEELSRKMAEVKLINEKFKQLETEKMEFIHAKDIFEKEKIALRDKQERLAIKEKKLDEKANRLQSLLAE